MNVPEEIQYIYYHCRQIKSIPRPKKYYELSKGEYLFWSDFYKEVPVKISFK